MNVRCPCGEDHSGDPRWPIVLGMVQSFGETIEITLTSGEGTWAVPRAWILLHGIKGAELPEVAARYGWKRLFRCPKCERVSYNANDLENRYCGACKEFFS